MKKAMPTNQNEKKAMKNYAVNTLNTFHQIMGSKDMKKSFNKT